MSTQPGLYDDALLIFFEEAREMLLQIENCLLSLDQDPDNQESIHALFRAAHTIKGTSGIFNLNRVVRFTHQVESILDKVRKGGLIIDAPLNGLLLDSCDMIARLLSESEQHSQDPALLSTTDHAADVIAQRLGHYLGTTPQAASDTEGINTHASKPGTTTEEQVSAGAIWHLSLRFRVDTFRNGFDPLTVIDYLATLGEITTIITVDDATPSWEEFDPESCYLGFELGLSTVASKATIEEAFEFVRDDCAIRIIPPTRRAADFIALINELPHEQRLGDILVACGAVSRAALDQALLQQSTPEDGTPRQGGQAIGEILVAQNKVATEVVDAALERQARQSGANRQEGGLFVRVPADKLDELINLVGELVICGASASLLALKGNDPAMIGTTQQLSRLVEEIRNGALGLRMVRIGETFVRYRRVVHDISAELGKKVSLTIHGADTELDKSVVEKIGDPLMHLVRNSLDHGIELPQARLDAGKPADGLITLSARHDSGNIVIEVSDDGRGLDPDKLEQKGRERGLVGENQTLTLSEKFDLIFAPGFSTAEKVTNLSGRGVGMDVVRKNIEALRGTVRIGSILGQGTTIEIRLPLTLAIIDGFLVNIGNGAFVIPLHAVLECIDANPAELNLNDRSTGYIKLRGEVLPLLDLRSVFECAGPLPDKRRIVVVQSGEGLKAGLLVDRLDGEYQTVIKPLGKLFCHLRGISGSTVLGTGEVALILDVASLVKLAINQKSTHNNNQQKALRRDLRALGIEVNQ